MNFRTEIIYLTNFLKTNLTKFGVICVKRRQNAGFLSPRSSKIRVTKKKERRKRKSEEKRNNNGCAVSFYNGYFGDFWPKKRTVGRKRSIWRYVFKNPATAVEYPAK